MKLEKKHWAMLITGVVLLFLVYWFFFRKKKAESSFDPALPLIGGNESGYRTATTPVKKRFLSGESTGQKWVWTGQSGQKYCDYIGSDGIIHTVKYPCPQIKD